MRSRVTAPSAIVLRPAPSRLPVDGPSAEANFGEQLKGVRSNEGRIYVEYSSGDSAGDRELYDITEDPYQLNNLMDEGAPPPTSGSASRR